LKAYWPFSEALEKAAVTVTEAFPVSFVSCVDVAVTVTVLAVAGAVNNPEELIVPALAPQVTVEL